MNSFEPPVVIDTHCHLDDEAFAEDQEAVILRAQEAGVTRLITVGSSSNGFKPAYNALALAEKYSFIYPTAGIHPLSAEVPFDEEALFSLCAHPRMVAVGETGLDFFRDFASEEAQRRWFSAHIRIARAVKKPLIIHSRKAADACLSMLREEGKGEVRGVFHCYSEDAEFAKKLLDIGFLVSFPGFLTFKKSESSREIAKAIPLSQIMVETDAPYMAPEPYRGKRCESAWVVEVVKCLAQIKELSYEEVAKITTKNAEELFQI